MILEDQSRANVKRAAGTVSPKSDWLSPEVIKAMDYLTKQGKDMTKLKAEIDKEYAEMQDLKQKSPILYNSIAADAAATSVQKVFDVGIPKGCAEWDPVTFSALVRKIKVENPSIFPLRNFVDKKPLAAPRIITVPSKDKEDEKKFGSIDTAAATPTGEFIFNIKFMQAQMNWAFVTEAKPKSKKYKSNGGPFPDEWAPVEFLILHEFFHYTHADFHYKEILNGDPTIINWVGDFRSNYDLIKAGHHPVKGGLYNDEINYDRQKTYKEMYDIVEREFKKLNKQQQDMVKKKMEEMGDDHEPHSGEKQKRPGHQGDPTEEDLEDASAGGSKKAQAAEDGKEEGKEGEGKPNPKADRGGPGNGPSSPTAVDWKSIKPRYTWKQLIEKLVKSSDSVETTYQKVHRRNITGVHQAVQSGAGVVRPGEKIVPANLVKLCLVIDSSGSMHEAILRTFAEINKLFSDSSSSGALSKQFAIVEFSNDFHIYNCLMASGGKGSAHQISGVEGMKMAGSGKREDLSTIMSRHQSGGTNFSADLVSELKKFIAQKYNVVVMTDSDILVGSNSEHFLDLYHGHHQQVHAIFDSRETFVQAASTMKQASANFSHF